MVRTTIISFAMLGNTINKKFNEYSDVQGKEAFPDCPPILVIFFNRPEVFRRNLLSLSTFEPRKLFFACDGPRSNNSSDLLSIQKCKNVIKEIVNWPCEIEFLVADFNHGCDIWVPKAITWFFGKVDAGIILEDDCIIDVAFAKFSSELLEKYKDDYRVMNISAATFQVKKWGHVDYYFSIYPSNWGWATWSRAWAAFDPQLTGVKAFIDSDRFPSLIKSDYQRRYWVRFYKALKSGKYTFWDTKWLLSIWVSGGVSIAPNMNMILNIGFGSNATHTSHDWDKLKMVINAPDFPLRHPFDDMVPYPSADTTHFNIRYKPKILARLWHLKIRIFKFFNYSFRAR